MMNALREELAALEHEQWTRWMKHIFAKSIEHSDGHVEIPLDFVLRWKRQINTPYADLSESEKDSDRAEADKILDLIAQFNNQ